MLDYLWPSWEGLEPSFPVSAVIYTLTKLERPPETDIELEVGMKNIFGSFTLYYNLSPAEGYERAVQEAERGGYIVKTDRGYITTVVSDDTVKTFDEIREIFSRRQ
jgi:hypothetical protein